MSLQLLPSALAAFLDSSVENIVVLEATKLVTYSLKEDTCVYNKGRHFYEIFSFFFLQVFIYC